METRWQIVKQLNRIRNRMKRWLSIYFPEFNQVFANWEGKAALIVLQDFPTPTRILERGVEGIVGRWKQDKLRGIGRKRAMRLIEAAKQSVGVREGLMAAENDLLNMLENYKLQMQHYEKTMNMVEQLVKQIPGLAEIVKIKGVGLVTGAGFVAEVGDISRFEHPKQIQKLAGLNIKENSSGKHKGKSSISKRGRLPVKITAVPSSHAAGSQQ
ncbi:MAG: transposase [Candidatus Syntrophopropionicum ammoniitolerans]